MLSGSRKPVSNVTTTSSATSSSAFSGDVSPCFHRVMLLRCTPSVCAMSASESKARRADR